MDDYREWELARLSPPYRVPVREPVNEPGEVENEIPWPALRVEHPSTFTVDPSYAELLAALTSGGWLEVEVFGTFNAVRLSDDAPQAFRIEPTRETRVITVQSLTTRRGSQKNQLAHHFEVVHHYDGWVPARGGDEYIEITAPYEIVLDYRRAATMRPR